MSSLNNRLADSPVAIVGVSALFPKAGNVRDFWANVVAARDCIEPVPATHWKLTDHYDPDPTAPDKTYCDRGGFVPPTAFSPLEFGLPPNTLEVTDILQLLSLVVARDVLADAGTTGSSWYDPERTGVVLGITGANSLTQPLATRLQTPVLKQVIRSCGLSERDADEIADTFTKAFAPWEENSFPGMLGNVVAGRIANRFDLGGMNCTVDAACASSLAAVRMALDELLLGRADLMITGGCDAENTILMYLCFSKTPAFSKQGIIRPFDTGADGTLIGEGMGMLALKRLADAERDGDRVYAVIQGMGTSSDGRFKSIYAPRAKGQRLALQRAYADAGVTPAEIGLIEAHGTGTAVGDQTELEALTGVYTEGGARPGSASIGSVKSQIGHTKAAAGAAGMIKLALALHHQVLPPTINVTTPNAAVSAATSPFAVNSAAQPWLLDATHPRRLAALSAFGFGGTNFHCVLAEHLTQNQGTAARVAAGHPTARVLHWHAADPTALRALISSGAAPDDEAIPGAHARIAFAASDNASIETARNAALAGLDRQPQAGSWSTPQGVHFRRAAASGRIAAVFAGQGSQYLQMGRTAALAVPPIRAALEAANTQSSSESPLSQVIFTSVYNAEGKAQAEARLRSTQHAQPAIGALAAGQFAYLREIGFQAEGFLGHSFGELVATWAAGSLTDQELHTLARARGQAMAEAAAAGDGDPGAMAALGTDLDTARGLIQPYPGLAVCNDNAPNEVVVGGATDQIDQLVQACKSNGTTATRLPVSAAFHTSHVRAALTAFQAAVNQVAFPAPQGTVYPNTPGASYGNDPVANRKTLAEQLINPVGFRQQVEQMYADGYRIFVEFGPKGVLTGMIGRSLKQDDVVAVNLDGGPSKDADTQLKSAIAQLVALGLPLAGVNRYWSAPPAARAVKGMEIPLLGVNHVSAKRAAAFEAALAKGYQAEGVGQFVSTAAPVAEPAEAVLGVEPGPIADRLIGLLREAGQTPPVTAIAPAAPALLAPAVLAAPLVTASVAAPAAPAQVTVAALSVPASEVSSSIPFSRTGGSASRAGSSGSGSSSAGASGSGVSVGRSLASGAESGTSAPSKAVSDAVSARLLEIVADQTGYAADMLDLSMGVEADLGIDSIKRVQILGELKDSFPAAPMIGPDELGEIQTLGDIVTLVAGSLPSPAGEQAAASIAEPIAPPTPEPVAVAAVPPTVPAAVTVPAATGVTEAVRVRLLEIVADQTGYAADMLDLSMGVEADLGIDSIKRVQILGELKDSFPAAPMIGPDELGEIQTLGDIVALVAGSLPAPAGEPVAEQAAEPIARPVASPVASVVAAPAAVPASTSDAVTEAVRDRLLEIVADQTGYAADMLDLSMGVEADLGIDSIKRVQILGELKDSFPAAPMIGPDELGEIQTLGDIVTLVAGSLAAPAVEPVAEPIPAPAQPAGRNNEPAPGIAAGEGVDSAVTEAVRVRLLEIVADQTGYAADMLDLSMGVEADLGIDSIKRVQILGELKDSFPAAPMIGPDELGEIQTLGDIVTLVAGSLADPSDGVTVEVAAPTIEAPVAEPTIAEPTIAADATSSAPSAEVAEAVRVRLLEIVADQTGYAADMLDLSMGVEADLGIDSIKRVQILGELKDSFPAAPMIGPDELGEIQTLGDIVTLVAGSLAGPTAEPGTGPVTEPAAATEPAAIAQPAPTVIEPEPQVDATGDAPPPAFAEGIARGRLTLRELPEPDRLLLPTGQVALIVDDGRHGLFLAYALQKAGWRVHLLAVPGAKALPGAHVLNDWSQATLTETVNAVVAAEGTLHLCAYLAGGPVEDGDVPAAQQRLVHALGTAKAATPGLEAGPQRSLFLTVTALDGAFGTRGTASPSSAVLGGLSGLVKTLAIESPTIAARHVDLAPGLAPEKIAEFLLAEVEDTDRQLHEVGRSIEQRVTWAIIPDDGDGDRSAALSSDDVLVVTGGGRGVTAACAVELAKRYRPTLVLLGRSATAAEPEWAAGVAQDDLRKAAVESARAAGQKPNLREIEQGVRSIAAGREVQATLMAIRAHGGRADYLAVDVSDPAAIRAALAAYQGRITGVVHGAGTLFDELIAKADTAKAEQVLDVKIGGLASVLAAIEGGAGPGSKLRHLVLFSSVAGLFGNRGQASYAMANEALNRLVPAIRGAHPGMHVTSVNWGAWAGGMVSPQLAAMFAERGVTLIPVPAGAGFLAEQFEAGHLADTVVVVGPDVPLSSGEPQVPGDAVRSRSLLAGLTEHPAIESHRINGNPVLPLSFALGAMIGAAEQACDTTVTQIRDVRVLKGVVFDQQAPGALDLELIAGPVPPGSQRAETVKLSVQSVLQDGARRPAYQATLGWDTVRPTAGALPPVTAKPAGHLYQDGTLFHGSKLRGITGIGDGAHGPDELVLTCNLADLPVPQGRWSGARYSPVLFDLLLQACLVWVRAKSDSPSLPLGIAEVDLFAPLPSGEEFTVQIRGQLRDSTRASCDVVARAADGRVLQELRGVQLVLKPDLGAGPNAGTRSNSASRFEKKG